MNLTVYKYDPADPSRVYLDEAKAIYSSTSYDLTVVADDFKADRSSVCCAKLLRSSDDGLVEYAACNLLPDPYHRDWRVGVLVVGNSEHKALFDTLSAAGCPTAYNDFVLSVTLGAGNNKVVYAAVPVVVAQKGSSDSGGSGGSGGSDSGGSGSGKTVASTSDLWKRVDLSALALGTNTVGTPTGMAFSVPLRDRSVTECSIDLRTLSKVVDFHVVPMSADGASAFTGDFFEAYIMVQTFEDSSAESARCWKSAGTAGESGRRLGRIVRGTALPPATVLTFYSFSWDYMDSTSLKSSDGQFLVRVLKYPFDASWHAEFRVLGADAIGVAPDPDGDVVPAAGCFFGTT